MSCRCPLLEVIGELLNFSVGSAKILRKSMVVGCQSGQRISRWDDSDQPAVGFCDPCGVETFVFVVQSPGALRDPCNPCGILGGKLVGTLRVP